MDVQPNTPLERVQKEQYELQENLDKLKAMIRKGRPVFIDADHWKLLREQRMFMSVYNNILKRRIKLMGG